MPPHAGPPPPPGGYGYPPPPGASPGRPPLPFQSTHGFTGGAGGALDVLRKVRMVLLLIVGVPCLLLVGSVIVSSELAERRDYVIFDNATPDAVVVTVDGKPVATLEGSGMGGHSRLVEIAPGNHAVRVEASGALVDEGTIAIPSHGRFEKGMRAIYPIGAARYALVSVIYAAPNEQVDEKESLEELAPSGKLVPMPKELARIYVDEVDKRFSSSESIPNGAKFWKATHVCRVSRLGSRWLVGCEGAPAFADDADD